MKKPKVYYVRLKKMLVQLKQMQTELQQMHDEVEERYDNLSENRKYSDFGYEMEEAIDNLYNAYSDEIDSLIDYIDDAAFGFMTLPLADGYPSQRGYEEYEEMKQLDEAEKGTIAKFNNECAPTTITNDDDNSGNSKDYDEAIAALNSLAGMTGAYMGWKIGSSTGFNNMDEPKEAPKTYSGYSSDDPEWRDDDNDGYDDRDEANDGMDDRDYSSWEDDEDDNNGGSDGFDDFDGFDSFDGFGNFDGFDSDDYDRDERDW